MKDLPYSPFPTSRMRRNQCGHAREQQPHLEISVEVRKILKLLETAIELLHHRAGAIGGTKPIRDLFADPQGLCRIRMLGFNCRSEVCETLSIFLPDISSKQHVYERKQLALFRSHVSGELVAQACQLVQQDDQGATMRVAVALEQDCKALEPCELRPKRIVEGRHDVSGQVGERPARPLLHIGWCRQHGRKRQRELCVWQPMFAAHLGEPRSHATAGLDPEAFEDRQRLRMPEREVTEDCLRRECRLVHCRRDILVERS